jgi:hypothetical protein
MLRLVRRGANRGKLKSARFLLRLLGNRLGRVRVLLDAWFMRGRLILATVAEGHTVIGRMRRDLALYTVPRPPRRTRGRPRKYGERFTRGLTAAPAQRPNPVRQSRGRALPHGPGVGPLPERPGACGCSSNAPTAGTSRPRNAC